MQRKGVTAMKQIVASALAAIAALAINWGTAGAVTIPASELVHEPTKKVGTGLKGEYYNIRAGSRITTNSQADFIISYTDPTATFVAKLIDYPNGGDNTMGDTKTLAEFLGGNATGLSGSGSTTLDYSLFHFFGYINILDSFDVTVGNSTIDVKFALGSDDGSRLMIGGKTVVNNEGDHGFVFKNGTASFVEAGVYPIDLIFYENGGSTGIELFSSIPGGPNSGAPAGMGTYGIVPTSVLHQVIPAPEPSTMALLGMGFLGVGIAARRRKKH